MSNVILAEKIKNFIDSRRAAKLEALAKTIEKNSKSIALDDASAKASFELLSREMVLKEEAKYEINAWISDAATRAKEIHMITHAPKYTHGSATGNGVYSYNYSSKLVERYLLATSTISTKQIDIIGNAAALAIGAFLLLENEGQTLLDQLTNGDYTAIEPFAKSKNQLVDWVEGFNRALEPKELSSHKQSKQLYFPTSSNAYHLICPLFASTLAQAVYDRMTENRFSDESKEARKLRREEKYSNDKVVFYPQVAVQTYGGANKQNISKLNVSRGGKTFLFNTQPPMWRKIESPPSSAKNSFWKAYEHRVWPIVKSLRNYLEKIEQRDSTLVLREIRSNYVDDLVSALLQFSAEIQCMSYQAGWSAGSKLPLAEQYWLDPHREDSEFQKERNQMNWVDEVSEQFSRWLNHQLNGSKLLSLGDVELGEWKSSVRDALKRDLRSMSI